MKIIVSCLFCVCFLHNPSLAIAQHAEIGNNIDVEFLVKDIKTGVTSRLNYKFDPESLQKLNLTLQEVKSSWIEVDDGNAVIVTHGGRRIQTSRETKHIPKINIVTVGVSADQNLNLTMKDIINDTELVPLIFPPLEWEVDNVCSLKRIVVSPYDITINDNKIAIRHEAGEGLLLTAINPDTCVLTYQKLFFTNDFGVYRDLNSVVENLLPGRIIVLFSQSEGSFLLHDSTRRLLSEAGSQFVDHYLYGDAWIWAFVKDGSSLGEALIPNLRTKDHFNPLPSLEIQWLPSSQSSSIPDCSNWPQNDVWIARRTFCQLNDAIGNFCDCSAPFQFHPKLHNVRKSSQQHIPILILCGSRARAVLSLLESLSTQKTLNKAAITLVLDGDSTIIRQIAFILGLRIIIHQPVGYKSIRVSRNLRFGLFNALKIFPKAKAFIILEDDLLVSPDFYSYMTQLSPVFKLDPTIYAVSGFNFISSPNSSWDPTLTYRTEGHPAYGWMMPRSTIEELLPKWPHKAYFHDWDHLFAADMFRKGRQCVIPDVNRVYHNCVQANGIHVNPSWYGERQFLRKGLNNISEVVLQPYHRLIKANYEDEMRRLVSLATPIEVIDVYNITLPKSKTGVYAIFTQMKTEKDYEAFRLVADSLGTWIGSPVFHMNNHTWRLFIQGYPLLVVGIPFSYYTRYMPKSAPVYSVPEYATKHLLSDDVEKAKLPVITHGNFYRKDLESSKIKESLTSLPKSLFSIDNFTDLKSIFPP